MKLFIKNSINKPYLLKTLVAWFQAVTSTLWPFRHAYPGAYLEGALCHDPLPPWGHVKKQKSAKYTLKLRNQIMIKACMWKSLTLPGILAFIVISLRLEVAQISDFLIHAKILPL